MSTYNDASLIYYPSGYKAGTAYSLKPTDGSGDLTFTRASTATRVNESGLIEEVAANVPRLDNSQGGCSTLLLEPQRTNLALRSEEFDSASWAKVNSSVTANTTISPDGTLNADSIINNVGNNQFARIRQIPSVIIGQTYVYSCFFKRGSTNYGIIALFDGANFSAFFDLNNGTIENVSSGITTTIENFQDEWYKCSIIRTVATSSVQFLLSMSTNSSLNTSNLNDFVYIWGAQVELGSYPTSYIPTSGTAVTRVADNYVVNNVYTNGLITASGGTWFVHIIDNTIKRRGTGGKGIALSNTSTAAATTNGFKIANASGTPNRLYISRILSGSSVDYLTTTDTLKIGVTWNGTTANVWVNGVKVINSTSFTFTAMDYLTAQNGDVQKIIQSQMLFPTPLSDSDIIALTTI